MIWFGKRDRALESFAEAIRPELTAIRSPIASAELRDRILRDRLAGDRVILPVGRIGNRSTPRYVIAAAVVIGVVLALPFYRETKDETRNAQPAAAFSYLGGVARAQEAPPTNAPRLPAALPIHAERIRAGAFDYLRVWSDSSGRTVKRVESRLSVSGDIVGGTPAWRVVQDEKNSEAGMGSGGAGARTAETLFVAQRDLSLLSRAVHVRPYRRWNGINIQQRISGDSVNGRMTLDDVSGMRRIARRLPATYAPFLADAFAPLYLASVSLDRGWTGRVTLLGWAVVPNDVLVPVELRMTGEEQVTVPAGRFDCWRMAVRYPGGTFDYWVRTSDGIAIRVIEKQPDGGQRVVTLVGESRM